VEVLLLFQQAAYFAFNQPPLEEPPQELPATLDRMGRKLWLTYLIFTAVLVVAGRAEEPQTTRDLGAA
jgi:hypothetical protein